MTLASWDVLGGALKPWINLPSAGVKEKMFFGNAPGKSLDVLIERLSTLGLARVQVPPWSLSTLESKIDMASPTYPTMEEEKSESRRGIENDVTGQGLFPPAAEMQTAAGA